MADETTQPRSGVLNLTWTKEPGVCWREHFGSEGSAKEFLVRLPDGFLLSCGIDGYAERRAKKLAEIISNAA